MKRYKVVNRERWEIFKLIIGSTAMIAIVIAINQIFGAVMR